MKASLKTNAAEADQRLFEQILRRNVTLPLATGVVSSVLFVLVVLYLLSQLSVLQHERRVMMQTAELTTLIAESQNGVRGYIITGDSRFLETFDGAMPRFRAGLDTLVQLVGQNVASRERLRRAEAFHEEWQGFAKETIALRRQSSSEAAESVAGGRGKRLTDSIRAELAGVTESERQLIQQRTEAVKTTAMVLTGAYVVILLSFKGILVYFGRRDLLGLSQRFSKALQQQAEHNVYLEAQAWLRDAQSQLAEALSGRHDMASLGRKTLDFLADRLGSVVGALYIVEDGAQARRLAAYGLADQGDTRREQLAPSENLVNEVAASGRAIQLDTVPGNYLQVSSAVAEGPAATVLIAPFKHEGQVNGVIELGFLRPLRPRDVELLERLSTVVGSFIEAARFRMRLQELLQETQQLNNELQVQQEELRTTNEELEEQSRALKESQAHLENQQAELEQTNHQLSEFSRRVEDQRDALQRAQVQLEQRAEELQRASQYKSEFLANMSHELRTPLNSSLILAKLLADNPQGNLSPEQVKFAESIYAAGNDLLALINDILDIAKVEAGKLEIRPVSTPLAPLAAGLRQMFEPLAAEKHLELDVVIAGDAPPALYTDGQRLEQILKNLLSNAIKFTDRGTVALHVTRQGPASVAFEVHDSGIGIEPSQQEVIFEAFRQADGTTSRRHGGTGLGLSISRDLARLLGGEISLVSQPGQGSTFTLRLPLQPAATAGVPAALPAPAAPAVAKTSTKPPAAQAPAPRQASAPFIDDRERDPEGKRIVLVIEDDVRFAKILLDLARELGYHCLVALYGEEGCELSMRFSPQAVLLDMNLPDGSGLSVLQRLKENPQTRHIPVHVISVADYTEAALQMGAIGYAKKPATRDELQEVFNRFEERLSRKVKHVLVVEDDARQRESISHLIGDDDVRITAVSNGGEALDALTSGVFDCMVIDLSLPDMSGQELLRRMAADDSQSFPPVIVYTGRSLTRDEEAELMEYSRSIIIKGARSPERLLDEVTLFLHKVESDLSGERQRMLRAARNRDQAFEARRILVVDDDVRNVFALTSVLEQRGATVVMARNGREALDKLAQDEAVDLVLMDLMMPEMDGYSAMREIRRNPAWHRLPVIAVTAKATKEDQQKCLAAGANDYLAKPIDLDRLFSLIRVWMSKLERG